MSVRAVNKLLLISSMHIGRISEPNDLRGQRGEVKQETSVAWSRPFPVNIWLIFLAASPMDLVPRTMFTYIFDLTIPLYISICIEYTHYNRYEPV